MTQRTVNFILGGVAIFLYLGLWTTAVTLDKVWDAGKNAPAWADVLFFFSVLGIVFGSFGAIVAVIAGGCMAYEHFEEWYNRLPKGGRGDEA